MLFFRIRKMTEINSVGVQFNRKNDNKTLVLKKC